MRTNQELIIDQNKTVYRRFIQEVFNDRQLNKLDEFLSESYVYHDPPPGMLEGHEGIKQIVTVFRMALPDFTISIEELIAEGNKVCACTTLRGTHKGTLFGIPATGKVLTMASLAMFTIVNGYLFESWVKSGIVGLRKQLGIDA